MRFVRHLLLATLLGCTGFAVAAPVNINTADAATLAKQLKGVGPAKAAAIVQYREKHGPFKTADQLAQVDGIGKALVDNNRDVITVGTPSAPR